MQGMFNRISQKCFDRCVTSLRTSSLEKGEVACINNCSLKYKKGWDRINKRFAEQMQPGQGFGGLKPV